MATSVVGHTGFYERRPERSESPLVEILVDDDENDKFHLQRNRRHQNRRKLVRKRSADDFSQGTTAKEHALDHYQRTLNKKYTELKRLVLEAVDFRGKSSEFNRHARQLIQQYSPRRAVSPPLRPTVERRTAIEFDNQLNKTDRQAVGRSRRRGVDRESDKNERRQPAEDPFSSRHENDYTRTNAQQKRVTFDDSYRASSIGNLSRNSSDMTSDASQVVQRHRASKDMLARPVTASYRDRSPPRHTSSGSNAWNDIQTEHVGGGEITRSKSRSQLDEQDMIYYTRQIPRRKIKATSSSMTDVNLSGDDGRRENVKKRQINVRMKSNCVAPADDTGGSLAEESSSVRPKPRNAADDKGSVEDVETRSRARRRRSLPKTSNKNGGGDNDDSNLIRDPVGSQSPGRRNSRRGSAGSPSPAGRHSRSPSSNTKPVDYHLKFTANDEIRSWLRDKNKLERKRKREERRQQKAKQAEEQRKDEQKAARKERADSIYKQWVKEKRREDKLLRAKQRKQAVKSEDSSPRQSDEKVTEVGVQSGASSDAKGSRNSRQSQVPAFSRLRKYDSFPGASTWTRPGKRLTEEQRRQAYEDWLVNKRQPHAASSQTTAELHQATPDADPTKQKTNAPEQTKHQNGVLTRSASARKDRSQRVGNPDRIRSESSTRSVHQNHRVHQQRPEPQGAELTDHVVATSARSGGEINEYKTGKKLDKVEPSAGEGSRLHAARGRATDDVMESQTSAVGLLASLTLNGDELSLSADPSPGTTNVDDDEWHSSSARSATDEKRNDSKAADEIAEVIDESADGDDYVNDVTSRSVSSLLD